MVTNQTRPIDVKWMSRVLRTKILIRAAVHSDAPGPWLADIQLLGAHHCSQQNSLSGEYPTTEALCVMYRYLPQGILVFRVPKPGLYLERPLDPEQYAMVLDGIRKRWSAAQPEAWSQRRFVIAISTDPGQLDLLRPFDPRLLVACVKLEDALDRALQQHERGTLRASLERVRDHFSAFLAGRIAGMYQSKTQL